MNTGLNILQLLTGLLYAASGIMKLFMFDQISKDVPSFGALPRGVWAALGVLELVCAAGLIGPTVFNGNPLLIVGAAAVLALESLVFIGVHLKYREVKAVAMSAGLGLIMAGIAYGRLGVTFAPLFASHTGKIDLTP